MFRLSTLVVSIAGIALAGSASGALIGISTTAPTVDGADQGNTTYSSSLKTWSDTSNHGQSFTTGGDAGYYLNSVSFQVQGASKAGATPGTRTFDLRLVSISGISTTTVALETGHTYSGPWAAESWFTFTFDAPVLLAGSSQYGIDIEQTGGGDWGNGITYFRYNSSDVHAGGSRYSRADGDPSSLSANLSHDLVFHADMTAVPEPGSLALMSLGGLLIIRRRRDVA